MQYYTFLEEAGNGLSGGEKQRIALARAFLKKNEFYILDESTSNLDFATENIIFDMIYNKFRNAAGEFCGERGRNDLCGRGNCNSDWVVGGAINVGIGILCGGISGLCAKAAAGYSAKAAARKLFAKKLAKQLMAKGIACSVASAITGSISTVLTFIGGILDPGNYIARYFDSRDKKPNNGWCDL